MKQQDKPFITRFRLKERGWTDGMIKKFLGEPDDTLEKKKNFQRGFRKVKI